MSYQVQPVYLISVNNTPQRAKELIAILIDGLKEKYNLVHLANAEAIEGAKTLLESLVPVPQLLICSSQWTAEQQQEVQKMARVTIPGIKTIAIPPGLNATKGGEAVVEFLKEQVLRLDLPTRALCNCKQGLCTH